MGFGKDNKGVMLRESVAGAALGALAQNAGVLISGPTLIEDFRMLKAEIAAVVVALQASEGIGLQLYLVQQDLSLAEAEACIETEGPVGPSDRTAMETAERFVRYIGAIDPATGISATEKQMVDGYTGAPLMVAKPRWTFPNVSTEVSWNWMIFNLGATLTTGATLQLKATHYGVWLI